MTEHRRAVDAVTPTKSAGPIDRLGHALKSDEQPVIPDVRLSDLEPYVGLRYLSKLFKLMGVVLALLLVAEVVTGVVALLGLLGEASRLIVLSGLLWGVGDLAILLIDVGHDVRAARILLARQTHAVAPTTPAASRAPEPANGVARP